MPAPQQSGQEDHSTALIWIIAGTFVGIGLIWFLFKQYIVTAYLSIKLFEVDLIGYIFPRTQTLINVKTYIISALTNPMTVKFQDLTNVGDAVGYYLRIPLIIFILALGFVVYFSNLTRSFKRSYSMRELVELEHTNWPQITPVMKLDLIKTDIDKGPWAMAMTPMMFCKKHKLLEEIRAQRREGMTKKEWSRVEVALRRGEANKIFAVQLGPLWQGVNKLPPYTRALFAAFAARINADSQPAQDLLRQIAASSGGQLNFQGVDELLKKHENSKLVKNIVNTHAYVLTVMASMLEGARQDGVQASADFLWLKPIDRRLWYMMNTVGRQTPYVEVAGPYAHWVAEKEAGMRLIVPMVESATKALEIAIKEVVYHPEEKDETTEAPGNS